MDRKGKAKKNRKNNMEAAARFILLPSTKQQVVAMFRVSEKANLLLEKKIDIFPLYKMSPGAGHFHKG